MRTKEQAVDYVNERGFVYFWPIKDVILPSVWGAVAGDRPVADAHDDPGHVTWGWKDELLRARKWHYAKVLRKKATMISLDVLPCFYALSQNYGEPEHDYLDQYKAGQMTYDAKTVYEVLLEKGPLDTPELRRQAQMTAKASDSPFNRAIEFLQADFKVQPVGVAEVGRWKYAFVYECVHRWNPELAEQARTIRQSQARENLVELYLKSVGAVQAKQVDMLFGWGKAETAKTVDALPCGRASLPRTWACPSTGTVGWRSRRWLGSAGDRDDGNSPRSVRQMNVEEEYLDLLQNIEFVIVGVCRREPMLVDFDVENAINGLVVKYQAEAQSHEPRQPRLNERAREVYDSVETLCEWRLGGEALLSAEMKAQGPRARARQLGRDRGVPEAHPEVRSEMEQGGRTTGLPDLHPAVRSIAEEQGQADPRYVRHVGFRPELDPTKSGGQESAAVDGRNKRIDRGRALHAARSARAGLSKGLNPVFAE